MPHVLFCEMGKAGHRARPFCVSRPSGRHRHGARTRAAAANSGSPRAADPNNHGARRRDPSVGTPNATCAIPSAPAPRYGTGGVTGRYKRVNCLARRPEPMPKMSQAQSRKR
jgi:hypothetical protein